MTNERLNEIIARIVITLKAIVLNDDVEVDFNKGKEPDYIDRWNDIKLGYTEPPKWEKWFNNIVIFLIIVLIVIFFKSVNFK